MNSWYLKSFTDCCFFHQSSSWQQTTQTTASCSKSGDGLKQFPSLLRKVWHFAVTSRAVFFPMLYKAEVLSHPVRACKPIKLFDISTPNCWEISFTSMCLVPLASPSTKDDTTWKLIWSARAMQITKTSESGLCIMTRWHPWRRACDACNIIRVSASSWLHASSSTSSVNPLG